MISHIINEKFYLNKVFEPFRNLCYIDLFFALVLTVKDIYVKLNPTNLNLMWPVIFISTEKEILLKSDLLISLATGVNMYSIDTTV